MISSPVNQPGGNWQIEKLGELVDPTHIQVNGSFHLHAVNGAFYNTGETGYSERFCNLIFIDLHLLLMMQLLSPLELLIHSLLH